MKSSNKRPAQGLSRQRVNEVERLTTALRRLFKPDAVGEWFDVPNAAFGGLKPMEIIERGETDRLWRMIFEIQSGGHV